MFFTLNLLIKRLKKLPPELQENFVRDIENIIFE